MSKFRVIYKDGSVEEVEQSDCHTLGAFINTKFGSADYQSNGVTVEMIENLPYEKAKDLYEKKVDIGEIKTSALDAASSENIVLTENLKSVVVENIEPVKVAKKAVAKK